MAQAVHLFSKLADEDGPPADGGALLPTEPHADLIGSRSGLILTLVPSSQTQSNAVKHVEDLLVDQVKSIKEQGTDSTSSPETSESGRRNSRLPPTKWAPNQQSDADASPAILPVGRKRSNTSIFDKSTSLLAENFITGSHSGGPSKTVGKHESSSAIFDATFPATGPSSSEQGSYARLPAQSKSAVLDTAIFSDPADTANPLSDLSSKSAAPRVSTANLQSETRGQIMASHAMHSEFSAQSGAFELASGIQTSLSNSFVVPEPTPNSLNLSPMPTSALTSDSSDTSARSAPLSSTDLSLDRSQLKTCQRLGETIDKPDQMAEPLDRVPSPSSVQHDPHVRSYRDTVADKARSGPLFSLQNVGPDTCLFSGVHVKSPPALDRDSDHQLHDSEAPPSFEVAAEKADFEPYAGDEAAEAGHLGVLDTMLDQIRQLKPVASTQSERNVSEKVVQEVGDMEAANKPDPSACAEASLVFEPADGNCLYGLELMGMDRSYERDVVDSAAEAVNIGPSGPVKEQRSERKTLTSSISEGDVLFELIEEVAVSACGVENDKPRDSLIERTTSWIKNTLVQQHPSEGAAIDPQFSQHDTLSIASIAASDPEDETNHAAELERSPIAEPASAQSSHVSSPPEADEIDSTDEPGSTRPITSTFVFGAENVVQTGRRVSHAGLPEALVAHREPSEVDQRIVRSYSQRLNSGRTPLKAVKKAPGRLNIPDYKQDETTPRKAPGRLRLPERKQFIAAASEETPGRLILPEREPGVEPFKNSPGRLNMPEYKNDVETSAKKLPGRIKARKLEDDVVPVRRLPGRIVLPNLEQDVVKEARKAPGRLQIPKHEADISIVARKTPGRLIMLERHENRKPDRGRRDSLQLLSFRKVANAIAEQQSASDREERRSELLAIATRSGKLDSALRARIHAGLRHPEADTAAPQSPRQDHVGRMSKDRDIDFDSSDDDEVASVTVGKHLTLKRMSGLTVHSTPRRQLRRLSGKLTRRNVEDISPRKSTELSRTLSKPLLVPSLQQPITRERNAPAKETSGGLESGKGQLCHPVPSTTATPSSSEPVHGSTRARSLHVEALAGVPTHSMIVAEGVQLQKILRSGNSIESMDEQYQVGYPPEQPSLSAATPRVEARTLKPLRLASSRSASGTPRRPDVSVTNTTTPHTTPSELWTLNPANSALTEETSVSRSVESQAHLSSRRRMRDRSVETTETDESQIRMPSVYSLHPISREQERRRREAHNHYAEHPASTRFRQASLGNSESRSDHRSNSDREPHRANPETGPSRQGVGSSASMPGFQISFQIQEPQMAPNCPAGTLMEFGFRVLIKPIGDDSTSPAWMLAPSSRPDVDARLRTSERNCPPLNSAQYEYSNLPPSEMNKVQEEAQEYLQRSLTSPRPVGHRSTSEASWRLPSIGLAGVDSGKGLSSPFLGVSSPASSDRPYREMMLGRSRQSSISHSVMSGMLSPAPRPAARPVDSATPFRRRAASAALASPLPYIKRAASRNHPSAVPALL